MKKFSGIFPGIYVALKKREQILQEYSRCQSKLEKYQDKERTGPNLAKLEQVRGVKLAVARVPWTTQILPGNLKVRLCCPDSYMYYKISLLLFYVDFVQINACI